MERRRAIAAATLAMAMVLAAVPMAATGRTGGGDAAALAEQLKATRAQLQAMQAQLDALQARVDAQMRAGDAAASAAAARANDAGAKAEQALVAADATTARQARGEQTLGAMAWAGNTTVGGRIFVDASTISQHTAGGPNTASGTGVNVKRVYLEFGHGFDDTFSAMVVTDASNVAGSTATGNGFAVGSTPVGRGLYVKNAYLQAKVDPALVVRIGAAPLPWVPFIEGQVGTRYVDTMLIDRVNYGTTADWGVHVSGEFAGGHVGYQLSVVDGAGYRFVKVTKAGDVEARVSAQYHGLWGALGGYIGKRGAAVQTLAGPDTFRTARRFDAAIGYKDARGGIGAEYFHARNWNNVAVDPALFALSQDAAQGWSVFGNIVIAPRWSAFGRYDRVQPNRITVPALHDRYASLGVQWEPVKSVDLALVYKREVVADGAIATQNGVIGCAATATPNFFAAAPAGCLGNGTFSELGIFTQVRF